MALQKPNWERDVVYLVQFRRVKCIPNLSPYCLKLETWLRIADLKYENVEAGVTTHSKKGQIPFVELNGAEIDDTYFIINSLTEIFHREDIESHLSKEEVAIARAFENLFDSSIFCVMLSLRLEKKEELFLTPLFEEATLAQKITKPVVSYMVEKFMKNKILQQGMGRHTKEEVMEIAKNDLRAVSNYLGKKKFMTGDKPTKLDATAFGHLCQLWYLPIGSETEIKKFMGTETSNLVEYLERIKSIYWPDWEEICTNLSLSTKWRDELLKGGQNKIQDAATS